MALVVAAGTVFALLSEPLVGGAYAATSTPAYYYVEYTDIGPNSTSVKAVEAGMTGTAWVDTLVVDQPLGAQCSIDTCPVIERAAYGLAPSGAGGMFGGPGAVIDEAGHLWTWRIAYRLTADAYHQASQFLSQAASAQGRSYSVIGDPDTSKPGNCMHLLADAEKKAGLADRWVPDYPNSPSTVTFDQIAPSWRDPMVLYSALSNSGDHSSVLGGQIEKNPEALSYDTRLNPPDACSALNLRHAMLVDPQGLADSLKIKFTKAAQGPFNLSASSTRETPPSQTAPYSLNYGFITPENRPPVGQYLNVVDNGDGTDSAEMDSPRQPCSDPQFSCSGHSGYPTTGPYSLRWFTLVKGTLAENDVTFNGVRPWSEPPNSDWDIPPVPVGGDSPYCSTPPSAPHSAASQRSSPSSSSCFFPIGLELRRDALSGDAQNVTFKATTVVVGEHLSLDGFKGRGLHDSHATWSVQYSDGATKQGLIARYSRTQTRSKWDLLDVAHSPGASALSFYPVITGTYTFTYRLPGPRTFATWTLHVVAPTVGEPELLSRADTVGVVDGVLKSYQAAKPSDVSYHLRYRLHRPDSFPEVAGQMFVTQLINRHTTDKQCVLDTTRVQTGKGKRAKYVPEFQLDLDRKYHTTYYADHSEAVPPSGDDVVFDHVDTPQVPVKATRFVNYSDNITLLTYLEYQPDHGMPVALDEYSFRYSASGVTYNMHIADWQYAKRSRPTPGHSNFIIDPPVQSWNHGHFNPAIYDNAAYNRPC